ncbi:hypothetical protein ACFQGA_06150 [Marinobacter koreensis]|uniref:Uncharacterized protein n=1 Tax=Marinobacter koreensis TaxID=335974 RepID=A0ABW0RJK2_9GAMM|nr:hypothetical protein [Marinobacter koreensis]MCK7546552.1 hypothetical protein [Marinobacter koreensis]
MSSNKPNTGSDEIWQQHLRWLDLISNECRSNREKREREKRRNEQQG